MIMLIEWMNEWISKSGHGRGSEVGLKKVDDFLTAKTQYMNNMWGGGGS